jgi:type II secretory pathway pseudopilin PulG
MNRRKQPVGYTIVELMLSLALLAMGSAGIITMQRLTAQSNRHAKQLATATHIAQAWLDQLVADASQWQTSGQFGQTDWLGQNGTTEWFAPAFSTTRNWGAAFDQEGRPQQFAGDNTMFCTNLRFAWLYPETTATAEGAGLLRAEVRVFWQRTPVAQLTIPLGTNPCGWTIQNMNGENGVLAHHFVYLSTALLQAPRP